MGHFWIFKTLDLLREHFYWPHMKVVVQIFCDKCIVCKKTKSKIMSHEFYTLLPTPWISLDWHLYGIFLELSRTKNVKGSILVVVDRFSKTNIIIPCNKVDDACQRSGVPS